VRDLRRGRPNGDESQHSPWFFKHIHLPHAILEES